MARKLRRGFIIPDAHFPYQDIHAWKLTIKAAKYFKPDILINLGDCFDFNCLSSFRKTPIQLKNRDLLMDELYNVKDAVRDMDSIGAKRKIFCEGNHEQRLDKYVADYAPLLTGYLNVPDLTGMDKSWEYIAHGDHAQIGSTYFTHDIGFSGANAVSSSQRAYGTSVVIGHSHRMDYKVTGNVHGESRTGASFGWLGDTTEVEYMHKVKINREWTHGFGIFYYDTETGHVYITPVPIVDGVVCLEGKIIR